MLPQARPLPSPRAAVTAAFIAYGTSAGLWAGAIPAITRNAGIDNLALGLGITFYGIAYVIIMSWGGKLALIATNRAIILASLPLLALSQTFLFLSSGPAWFLVALIVFGACQGALDLFMNAEGSYVESDLGRPIFTRFHASASAAMALFAIIGSLVIADAGRFWAAAILWLMLLAAFLFIAQRLPGRFSAMARATPGMPAPRLSPLIILGLAAGLVIAGETAAIMWSAKLLDEQAPALLAIAGLGTAFYGLCNACLRFLGDDIRARFGDISLIIGSLLLATVGFAFIGISQSFLFSTVAFALTGFGTACVIPAIFALTAKHMSENRARALGIVALVAGLPRVMAPWFFGWIATLHSTSFAFGLCAVAMAVALGFILLLQVLLRRTAAPVRTPAL
ncbi:MFS transporter [Taklimakanibacter deserti]|uniref:MFS transporter n=1 Tax=Taklimakanibacter deserti TaxID=2267839 RepID=UPI000E654CE3